MEVEQIVEGSTLVNGQWTPATARSRATGRLAAVVVAGLTLLNVGVAHRVDAQTATTTTTTTVAPSPTTTPPTATPPPSPPPAAPAPSPPPPAPPPRAELEEDSPSESVPTEPVPIPPPSPAPPASPVPPQAAEKLQRDLADASAARDAALRRVQDLMAEVVPLQGRLAQLDAEHQQRVTRLVEAKLRLKKTAVARYVATPVAPLDNTLKAPDFVDLTRRVAMMGAVTDADRKQIVDHESARRAVAGEMERLVADLARAQAGLAAAKSALDSADATVLAMQVQAGAGQPGAPLGAGGLVFPVSGPHTFTDSFGAPRMFGTPFAHLHQGTDVFAPAGTPLVAIERGVLIRVGTDVLGGTKLWLAGASGTRYFYAHLQAFAPGVVEGKAVQAGEVVGFVGNSGNARGTSPHLHFEVHPGGGPAINPYPLLRIVDRP